MYCPGLIGAILSILGIIVLIWFLQKLKVGFFEDYGKHITYWVPVIIVGLYIYSLFDPFDKCD